MYNYDRTAADETKDAIKWLGPKRKQVIKKALKAMSDELDKLNDEAKEQFPGASWDKVMAAMSEGEKSIRDGLRG